MKASRTLITEMYDRRHWRAHYDDYKPARINEPIGLIGFGRTEQKAIKDLKRSEQARNNDKGWKESNWWERLGLILCMIPILLIPVGLPLIMGIAIGWLFGAPWSEIWLCYKGIMTFSAFVGIIMAVGYGLIWLCGAISFAISKGYRFKDFKERMHHEAQNCPDWEGNY